MTITYSAQSVAPQKSRTTLLPLLVVLFVASYTILTLLVVEQGRTIEAQRGLLREMLKDSAQLADLKSKMAHSEAVHAPAKAAPQAAPKQRVSGQPGSAAEKPVAPEPKRPGTSARTSKQVPAIPAEDLQDIRRSKKII